MEEIYKPDADGPEKVEVYSRENNDMLGDMPEWLIHTGSYIVYGLIVFLIAGTALFKYPDTIRKTITIDDLGSAEWITANQTGMIDRFFVENQSPVQKNDCRKPPLHDINDIRHMLPHRPPFLLVDRIFHRDATDVAGIKNVTMNEPFFVGHFPEEPVMPGVLIVEAMAQCSGILVLGDVPDPENYSTYFMKIDGVKFKRKVVPGDTLQFEIHLMEPIRRGVAVVEAKAFVGETLACEAVLMAQVVKNKNNK